MGSVIMLAFVSVEARNSIRGMAKLEVEGAIVQGTEERIAAPAAY